MSSSKRLVDDFCKCGIVIDEATGLSALHFKSYHKEESMVDRLEAIYQHFAETATPCCEMSNEVEASCIPLERLGTIISELRRLEWK